MKCLPGLRFMVPGGAKRKTLYVVFCQRRIFGVMPSARWEFGGAGLNGGYLPGS
jgi:hypothetical protein